MERWLTSGWSGRGYRRRFARVVWQSSRNSSVAPDAWAAPPLSRQLGADGMNFEKDNAWLLGQVAWRGMSPAQVTFGR